MFSSVGIQTRYAWWIANALLRRHILLAHFGNWVLDSLSLIQQICWFCQGCISPPTVLWTKAINITAEVLNNSLQPSHSITFLFLFPSLYHSHAANGAGRTVGRLLLRCMLGKLFNGPCNNSHAILNDPKHFWACVWHALFCAWKWKRKQERQGFWRDDTEV